MAISMFNEHVKNMIDSLLSNGYLDVSINIHKYKAIIKEQSIHHVFAVVDDMNRSIV